MLNLSTAPIRVLSDVRDLHDISKDDIGAMLFMVAPGATISVPKGMLFRATASKAHANCRHDVELLPLWVAPGNLQVLFGGKSPSDSTNVATDVPHATVDTMQQMLDQFSSVDGTGIAKDRAIITVRSHTECHFVRVIVLGQLAFLRIPCFVDGSRADHQKMIHNVMISGYPLP